MDTCEADERLGRIEELMDDLSECLGTLAEAARRRGDVDLGILARLMADKVWRAISIADGSMSVRESLEED